MKSLLTPATLALFCSASIAAGASFYKDEHGLFSLRPSAESAITNLTRFGPIGLSIDLMQPAFTIRISGVEPGSPAAATGQLKEGMIIESINGEKLADIDPRIQMGNWITKAESTDGRLVMRVADAAGGQTREVIVELPVLGSFSETWPLDCPKSDKIVRNFAEYLKQPGANPGFSNIGMLFLLSTGDESDLEFVGNWARSVKDVSTLVWHVGYGGPAVCEYYLRTGDKEVLPLIQKMADRLVEFESFGGWIGRGAIANLNYGGGGGHLNAAGVPGATTLFLAHLCGAEIPEDTLQRVLERFYRYSGRGNVPYGMGKPESGYTDNGKNGKLAYAMAAAALLDKRGEESIYARARDVSAQFSFYSTTYMLHGHTGGGIGEIWRSAAMGLLHDKLPNHYREFMDNRRWHYEMSRRFDGSFAILGGDRYDNVEWGAGYALTFTVPRRTLQLTGAPRSKFARPIELPERPWGNAADDDFQSIVPAVCGDGEPYSIDDETLAGNSGLPMVRLLNQGNADADTVRKYILHPNYVIRNMASRSLHHHGIEMLMEFLACDDARVRRAALEGVNHKPDTLLTRPVFDHIVGMIRNPEESWFIQEYALQLMGKASADWIVEQVDLILPFFQHDEWWFHHSAISAITPIVADERVYRKVLPALGDFLKSNYRYSLSAPLRWGALPENIRNASPEVQAVARESLKEAYVGFVNFDHHVDQIVNTVNPTMRSALAESLVTLPGGYDTLYQIGRQKFPDEELPFREMFLKANPEHLSPELREIINESIGGNLIPEFVAKHRDVLLKEAASEDVGRNSRIDGLVDLYRQVGVHEFDWADFGPAHDEMEWYYHSFDPAEQWLRQDDRLGRYREITFPAGLENWYAKDFDPGAGNWRRGRAPFAAADGEVRIPARGTCHLSFCKCADPVHTLWENDVLLIRGDFEIPPFEEGYRYRLLHAGISHVGSGGGYRLYVNGRLFIEDKRAVDRREGGRPKGRVIPRDWWSEFEGGKVTLAAISFKKTDPHTRLYGGNISFFIQRMKVPPLDAE